MSSATDHTARGQTFHGPPYNAPEGGVYFPSLVMTGMITWFNSTNEKLWHPGCGSPCLCSFFRKTTTIPDKGFITSLRHANIGEAGLWQAYYEHIAKHNKERRSGRIRSLKFGNHLLPKQNQDHPDRYNCLSLWGAPQGHPKRMFSHTLSHSPTAVKLHLVSFVWCPSGNT